MFKKRQVKGSFKKSEVLSDDEAGDDDVNKIALNEVRLRQECRKRKMSNAIVQPEYKELIGHKSEKMQSVSSMIDSQFSSRKGGETDFRQHEKIMERYVNKKLSEVLGSNTPASESLGAKDGNPSQAARDFNSLEKSRTDDIGLLGEGSGLTEVQLPSYYKMKNAQETENAKKALQDASNGEGNYKGLSLTTDLAAFRFQKPLLAAFIPKESEQSKSSTSTNRRRYPESEKLGMVLSSIMKDQDGPSGASAPPVDVPTVPLPSDVYTVEKKKQRMPADDYLLNKFKQVHYHHQQQHGK